MAKNEITGDEIKTKSPTEKYLSGWDMIFGKKDDKRRDELDKAEKLLKKTISSRKERSERIQEKILQKDDGDLA